MKALKFLLAVLVVCMCGCKRDVTQVKCIGVHMYGVDDGLASKSWYSFMVIERVDTKERKKSRHILGKEGDVFSFDWNSWNADAFIN